MKEDILSEEQDGDDEDSIHNGGDTIMDECEDEEILSEHSGSAAAVEIEEEKLFTDNRSNQGDNETEIPCYYCSNCKQQHFQKCLETATTFSTNSDISHPSL